jgi:hypothetical protein
MLLGALLMGMSTVCVANQVTSVVTPPSLNVLDVGDGRWRVTGTVSAGDPSTRMAVIEETDSGAAVLIRPGSRIFDGVRVEDVQRDFVALLVDGRSVHLRVSTGTGRGGGAQPAAFPLIALERMSPSEFGVSYEDFRAMLVAVSTSSSGNVVGRVRSSNNDSLLQIKAVQPSGVLDRLGLEAGDVVIAMQGEAIGGLAHAESVLNAVRPGTTLLVVYRRAESVRQLSIEVRRQDGGG